MDIVNQGKIYETERCFPYDEKKQYHFRSVTLLGNHIYSTKLPFLRYNFPVTWDLTPNGSWVCVTLKRIVKTTQLDTLNQEITDKTVMLFSI